MIVKYKRDSWEYYGHLLRVHDWYWRQSDDHRFVEQNIERENEIHRLQKIHDQRAELYNSYSPWKL